MKRIKMGLVVCFGAPVEGTHLVYSCVGDRISFTTLMNFIHELRHARDGMTGNFIGHRFEKDAVDSENELRKELGYPDDEQRCLRDDEDHIWQTWFPLTT